MREQRETQRSRVGGHVPGVGQQRERAGEPATDRFDEREASGQRERHAQRAQRRRIGHGMVVRIAVVRVQGMVVSVRGTHQGPVHTKSRMRTGGMPAGGHPVAKIALA